MHKTKNDFANNLWVKRKRLRLSQKHVAHLLGYKSTTMLSKYERGERPPPLFIAIKFSIIYQTTIEELFPAVYRDLRLQLLKIDSSKKITRPKKMSGILDRVAQSSGQFLPNDVLQFLALRIAHHLGDLSSLGRYLVLFEHYPQELLLKAYSEALKAGGVGEQFFAAFRKLTNQGE